MKFGRKDYDGGKAIPGDEPAFLLRAQDKFSGDVVRFYANLLESQGASAEVVISARKQAAEMDAWPTKKSPDITRGK